jgi:hypothetical protein
MLQDSVRTSTYQKAILSNAEQCFRGEHMNCLTGVLMTDILLGRQDSHGSVSVKG